MAMVQEFYLKKTELVENKPRVWFVCHPKDFDAHFNSIAWDLVNCRTCTVFYTPDMAETLAEDDREFCLNTCALCVVAVTRNLLTDPCRAMVQDIPFAWETGIRILPILLDKGLADLYSQKFGRLQYLTRPAKFTQADPYATELAKFMHSTLVSNETFQRIQQAFDARIFLSYRKKDRRLANALMRQIHSHPACRSIAVWFDGYLTLGEDFSLEIERMIRDCQLFTLLVTPRVTEKILDRDGLLRDNYVIDPELRLARERNTPIFPVEMVRTSRSALEEFGISSCISPKDPGFHDFLLEQLPELSSQTHRDDPEHTYLIGLAYLEGLYMEVDRKRGVEMITTAAEAGLEEAMTKLLNMYRYGSGTPLNYKKALYWGKRLLQHQKSLPQPNEDRMDELWDIVHTLCHQLPDYKTAYNLGKERYQYYLDKYGKLARKTINALDDMALSASKRGLKNALQLHRKAYKCYCQSPEAGPNHQDTILCLDNLALCYYNLGDSDQAWNLNRKAYEAFCRHPQFGPDHMETLECQALAATIRWQQSSRVGDALFMEGIRLATEAYQRMLQLSAGKATSHQALFLAENLAISRMDLGQWASALELLWNCYKTWCTRSGKDSERALATGKYLLHCCGNILRNEENSFRLRERALMCAGKLLGQQDLSVLFQTLELAHDYFLQGNLEKALKLLGNVMAQAQNSEIPDAQLPFACDLLQNLVIFLDELGSGASAVNMALQLHNLCLMRLGPAHPRTWKASDLLTDVCQKYTPGQ